MKNPLHIIRDNMAFSIIIVAIITIVYFGYQLISPVFSLIEANTEELKFDKISEKFKI